MRRAPWYMAVLVTLASVVPAAWADAGNPNYRSKLLSVSPTVKGLTVRVVDGDDALELRNSTGRNVMVPGYEGEPYLRFLANGRVEVNVNSPAKYLNEERYGGVKIPSAAGPKAKPRWQLIGEGGGYVWHEHRIHWMSTVPPPRVKKSGGETLVKVFDWNVPLKVGARRAKVSGTLWWIPTDELDRADALIATAEAKSARPRTTPVSKAQTGTTDSPATTPETETEPEPQLAAPVSTGGGDGWSPVLVGMIVVLALGLLAMGAYVLKLRRREAGPRGEVW